MYLNSQKVSTIFKVAKKLLASKLIVPRTFTLPVARCLPAQRRVGLNIVFFHIY